MQQRYLYVLEIKSQMEVLISQLSEGKYKSIDTYANNISHLNLVYSKLIPHINDKEFLDWLNTHHAVICSEIALTGKLIMILQNFFFLFSGLD